MTDQNLKHFIILIYNSSIPNTSITLKYRHNHQPFDSKEVAKN